MKLPRQAAESGFFGKLLALMVTVILLVVGFLFSVVVLAVIAVAALAVGAYFWWKTRKLRQLMRQQASYGQVIDGEAIVVDEFEFEEEERNVLPNDPPPR